MKILFLSDNFPPEVNAPASRTYEHCIEWVKKGHEVTVITCFPNYPQGVVYEGYKNRFCQVENVEGIRVVRTWSYIAENKGTIKRILDQLSSAFMAFWFGLFKKTDVIIATSPQFFVTISAYFLSRLKSKPWVFELRDLWPDTIIAVGAIRNDLVLKFLEWLELFLYKKSTKIVAVTDAFKENLIQRGINAKKIDVVTNGSNLSLFQPREKHIVLLRQLNLANKKIIGYIGTHGMTHGLDFIVRAIKKVTNPNIHFLFIGSGSEKEKIVELSKHLNLNNIIFLPPVSKEEIVKYISIIDIALVPLKKRDTFKTVIPSKIFELASMQKPILLGVEGQAKKIIDKYNAGIGFEPENEIDFLEKLTLLVEDQSLYQNFQKGCKQLAQDYDRKKLANQMLSCLESLIK